MSDRRRANRFVIPEAATGSFRMMQDVYVERIDEALVSVVADTPLPPGETLLLELPGGTGARAVVRVEVAASSGVIVGSAQRYRTVLRLVEPAARGDAERPTETRE